LAKLLLRTCSDVLRSTHSALGAGGAAVYFGGVPQTELRSSARSDGVERYRTGSKWGNLDENLLNGVISVKKLKLGGKNWNLLNLKTIDVISDTNFN
jgi:hypothetical protein